MTDIKTVHTTEQLLDMWDQTTKRNDPHPQLAFARAIEAAVLAASAPAQEQETMYQIRNLPNTPDAFKNCWFDASEDAYHLTPENHRRILYAAPVDV